MDNLRHAELHEHPPFRRMCQPLQARHQTQSITDPVRTAMFATGMVDNAVNPVPLVQAQKGRLLQKHARRHGGGEADQFNIETIRLVERFLAVETEHWQAQPALGQGQGEGTFLVIEHWHRLCQAIRESEGTKPQRGMVMSKTFFRIPLQGLVKLSIRHRVFLVDCRV